MKRVMIAAGGTGGHFYPGLVAAKELRRRGWEPLMIVRQNDSAIGTLERDGLAYLPVDLRGMPRTPGPEMFVFARKLAASLGTLTRAVRAFSPDLAFGMGGYLTFPLIYAAWRRGVPRAVHESNAMLGLANRTCAALDARLYWGLPPAQTFVGAKVVGTPVRPELWNRGDATAARAKLGLAADLPTLLVFGGSQGAQSINDAMPRALKDLPDVQTLHLAGKGKADAARESYAAFGVRADVREYLDDMAAAYAAADVVVCRSGASTLAELAAQRVPAVLIPYPHAAADHQNVNASVFEKVGAAVLIKEPRLSTGLRDVLVDLLKSNEAVSKRRDMAAAYSRLGLPQASAAAETFVNALEGI